MDIADKITPATTHGKVPGKLSYGDFQKLLSTWFEGSGMVSEMRSYLRLQLIKMLNTSKIGLEANQVPHHSYRTQVINVLIAEHLLKYKYFYTLSIFSNENTILNLLPEFSFLFVSEHDERQDVQFKETQILKILQYLGISLACRNSEDLISMYCNGKENGSFVSCLLSYLAQHCQCQIPTINKVSDPSIDSLVADIYNTFKQNSLDLNAFYQIEKILRQYLYTTTILSRSKLINSPVNNEKKKIQSEKSDITKSTPRKPDVRLIELHERKRKMIEQIYNFRLSQMLQMEEYFNENVKRKEDKVHMDVEPKAMCKLQHCDEQCSERVITVEELKTKNAELVELVKQKGVQVEELMFKLSSLITKLGTSQRKLKSFSRHSLKTQLPQDIDLLAKDDSDVQPPDVHEKASKLLKDNVYKDVYAQFEKLEEENKSLDLQFGTLKELYLD